MACRAGGNYTGSDTTAPFNNWSGDVIFSPALLRSPAHAPPVRGAHTPPAPTGPPFRRDPTDGLASLVEAVANATDTAQPLHAIGNTWAFEDCGKSDGIMVSLANLNRELFDVIDTRNGALTDDWLTRQASPTSKTCLAHFEAGIRIADLCEQLDKEGLAMATLGGSNGQSLAGALSTGTHGGEWQHPPLPDAVRAVHLVTVGGQELWIESASQPLTRSDDGNAALMAVLPCAETTVVRDDRLFNAVRVACGRFGVIYSFVLEVRRQFRVVSVVTTPPASAVLQALRDGQKTPSIFTPLFRLLNADAPAGGPSDATGVPYFLQILFNSQRPSDVWVTRRWETPPFELPDVPGSADKSYKDLAIAIVTLVNAALLELLGLTNAVVFNVTTAVATAVLGPLGTLLATGYTVDFTVQILALVAELVALVATGEKPFGSIVASALTAAWAIPGLGYLIPQIEGMLIEDNLRGGDGSRGKHYRMTTGSRASSEQDDYRVDSIELVFDATTPDYLDFLDEVLAAAPNHRQAGYISLRPSLRSTALLSMHNVTGARAIAIEITSLRNLLGNPAWMSYLESAALRHNGRPHWGQYNKLDSLSVEMAYGSSLTQWREALLGVCGTSTQFSNSFTRQRGLEPTRVVRTVTSVKRRRKTTTHLCNDLESWSPVPVADAVRQIQAGTAIYLAVSGESVAFIEVVSDGKGGFYLRSHADQTSADNLDQLPLSKRP